MYDNVNYFVLVFEFCQNGHLENLIKKIREKQEPNRSGQTAGISEQLARIYMAQLVNAVEYLQLNNIAHRDLKPLNILIDDNYNLKLIDFGEAKNINEV